jgi:WhiB family redox-sensing transcriptional regulator
MFFGSGDAQATRNAKKLCRGCEVIGECLVYALNHGERFGVWGGMSERERRNLMRANGVNDE